MTPTDNNGWERWKELVLDKLHGIETKLDCLEKKAYDSNARMSVVETKAKLWGAIFGLIAAVAAQILVKVL